ncbi:MAG: hypothetical protein WAL52_06620 [Candidatus Sulfotelmatobacter sp.]
MSTAASAAKNPASPRKKTSRQHVSHKCEYQRVVGQHRNQNGDENRHHKHQTGSDAKDPCRLIRHDLVLVKQLPNIPVGLHNRRAALALYHFLQAGKDARIQRRECQYEEDLKQVISDGFDHDR